MRKSRAMSLPELLIALSVAGLLAAMAIPAWSHARASVASAAVRAALHEALLGAMRVSTVARENVVLCASADQHRCSGSVAWEEGWIAFVDRDRDREPDEGGGLLRRQEAFGKDLRLRGTRGRTRIVLQPDGGAAAGSNATFTICDRRGPAHARRMVLAGSGGLRSSPVPPGSAVTCP